ncbi:glycosyltransferase [Flavobacterium sufflavum]|uniref:Glycosyltransferase n=1 Tax=Flavobacterium sufflavum TaxID=1921138 RepID=A0A437KUP1_9FLAO|nr:glycosyltransferase [Flavobacterium sufflavum]RVT75875.1 glycosyltransferase [Flavobacterium sufflavum]
MSKILAPIVLFTYNRPLHTQQILNSLAENLEAKDSILYIFCDGTKENVDADGLFKINKVRDICKNENRFKKVIITYQNKNKGLANSIIDGVTQVVNSYGKVIVLEDDLILSKFFLSYMNDALDRYETNLSVGQIGSCNFFACGKKYPNYFFVPLPDCLGWATWKDRWRFFNSNVDELKEKLENNESKKNIFNAYGSYNFTEMLEQQKEGKVDSWAIRWQAVCVLNGWLTLYPNPSMTNHIESEEATHANLNIIPPISIKKPNFNTIDVNEIDLVIKAFKLGYSGKGNYFGKEKRKYKKERIKKIVKLFIPPIVFVLWRKIFK